MLLQMEHQRVSLKGKKIQGGAGDNLPSSVSPARSRSRAGSCRPTEIPALDTEHTELSPGRAGVGALLCDGQGKLPVPLPRGNSSQGDSCLSHCTQKASLEEEETPSADALHQKGTACRRRAGF